MAFSSQIGQPSQNGHEAVRLVCLSCQAPRIKVDSFSTRDLVDKYIIHYTDYTIQIVYMHQNLCVSVYIYIYILNV